MTGRFPARSFSGLCLVLLLAGCGGAGTDTAAGGAAASAAQHVSGAAEPGHGTTGAAPTEAAPTGRDGAGDGSRGNPGGPGADPAGGGDVVAAGKPGAPGDVSVFEEGGVPYRVLKEDAAGKCADGVCTLLDPVIGAGNPEDVGGVDECVVQRQADIRYDPPAQDGFFQRGATVQATVDCTVDNSGTGGDTSGDTSGHTAGDSSADQVPTDEPQG